MTALRGQNPRAGKTTQLRGQGRTGRELRAIGLVRIQAGGFLQVLRAQRLGNDVLFAEPFSKVHQLAAT